MALNFSSTTVIRGWSLVQKKKKHIQWLFYGRLQKSWIISRMYWEDCLIITSLHFFYTCQLRSQDTSRRHMVDWYLAWICFWEVYHIASLGVGRKQSIEHPLHPRPSLCIDKLCTITLLYLEYCVTRSPDRQSHIGFVFNSFPAKCHLLCHLISNSHQGSQIYAAFTKRQHVCISDTVVC